MDSTTTEQRRRKKHSTKTTTKFFQSSSSVRSLVFGFSLLALLYFFAHRVYTYPTSFRPVLVLSNLNLLSSSVVESSRSFVQVNLEVQDRVAFPDHVLLILSGIDRDDGGNESVKKGVKDLECVYSGKSESLYRDVLSVDEYSEFRVIVRCPLAPVNYSALVTLRRRDGGVDFGVEEGNKMVVSWETLAYEAVVDGETAVVFVKGLSHRQNKESDPNQFSCHFGLGDSEFGATTNVLTAAQEVVRCALPDSIREELDKVEGVRVTVSMNPLVHARGQERVPVPVPSVAKLFSPTLEGKEKVLKRKYELCVCTMVWNQAYSLREWIAYHAWIGVERWFIYDNNSDDEIKEVIGELNEENYNVSRHVWPWIKTQEAGFSHCALRARDECKWVSFMDVDEFFYFPHPSFHHSRFRKLAYPGRNSLRSLVSKISSASSRIGEIRTACHSFGPSGLTSPPSQGVTVGYTCRLRSPERHKSIIRPDALAQTLMNVVHHFHLKKGFRSVNMHQSTAVINHYKYQVWETFKAKFYRRVATYVADWQDNQNEGSRDRAPGLGTEAIEPRNWRLQFCEVWDTGLRDFVLANMADRSSGILPWERSM